MDYMQNLPPLPEYAAGDPVDFAVKKNVDEFLVQPVQDVDILFIVDKSGSMLDDALQINSNVPTLLSTLDNLWIDYRIGVISTDASEGHGGQMGEYQGKQWIASEDDNPAWLFSMLMGSVGTEGEEGHDALAALIAHDDFYKMVRYQAPLEIVLISDESDQSDKSWTEVMGLLNWLSIVKDAPIRYSAIVQFPILDMTCTSDSAVFSDGWSYMVLADIFAGAKIEICNQDWSETFKDLLVYQMPTPTYFLSQRPDPSTIEVLIEYEDGQVVYNPLPPNWTYSDSENSVTIVNFPVPAGSTVKIAYTLASGVLELQQSDN